MLSMEYRAIDILNASQLEVDDLIGLDDEVVKIINIDSLKDNFVLTFENEFGETDVVEVEYNQKFKLYLFD